MNGRTDINPVIHGRKVLSPQVTNSSRSCQSASKLMLIIPLVPKYRRKIRRIPNKIIINLLIFLTVNPMTNPPIPPKPN